MSQTIYVSYSDWKPYFYKDGGQLKGSGYQIAKAVMEQAGFSAVYK